MRQYLTTKDNHKVSNVLTKIFLIRNVPTLVINEIRTKIIIKLVVGIIGFTFSIVSFGILGGMLFATVFIFWIWTYIG